MTPDDVEARLLPLLGEVVESPLPAQVTSDTGLLGRGIGLDSIEVLALVAAIEQEFDVTIADDQLRAEHFTTVGTLVAFVSDHVSR